MPMNTTTYHAINALGDLTGLGPVVLIAVYTTLVIVGVTFLYESAKAYEKLRKLIQFLGSTGRYFLKGVGVLALLTLGFLPFYFLNQQSAETQVNILRWIGLGVGLYFGISGLGWLGEKLWNRLKEHKERIAEEGGD